MTLDPIDMCLVCVHQGADAMQSGNFGKAELLFRMAEKQARSMPPDPASDFALLVQFHMSLLRHRLGKHEEGKKLHESAMTLLDENSARMEAVVALHDPMASVLMQHREYRRAIPFWERAIQNDSESKDSDAMIKTLTLLAQCYGLMGLKDHSAVPARAALKILREYPGDPRMPGVLITVGNAIRKSSPAEAESLYREAAEFYEAKAHLESATLAWSNLGVLCSEQGRYSEALEYFRKTLNVREQFPSTPLLLIGRLLNNMAMCYGRMGNCAEAHRLLDRAIRLLELDRQEGASMLPTAYGTRGFIFKSEGRDAEAVEWFQRSFAERKNTPSPNFESIVENLEEEIAALKRLGRPEEVMLAEDRLASVNTARNEIAYVDRDLSFLISQAGGSVFIEVGYGSRPGNQYGKKDSAKLAVDLMDELHSQNVGFCGGSVTIPESTTLMFYGEDADALFQVLEPILARERICQGASVTIRQGKEVREVILPGRVM